MENAVKTESILKQNNLRSKPITSGGILETFTSFEIEVELPHTATGDCMMSVEKGILTISGRGIKDLEVNLTTMSGERFRHSRFYRFILLLTGFGNERFQAACDNGLLYIHVPKGLLDGKFAYEIATRTEGSTEKQAG